MRFFCLLILIAVGLPACKRPAPAPPEIKAPTATPSPSPSPVATPTPAPTPTPVPVLPRKPIEMGRLFNGVTFRTKFATPQSEAPASRERSEEDSYEAEVKLTVKLPRPAATLEDLAENDPKLPEVINKMSALVASAKVSPYFSTLYENKIAAIRRRLFALDAVLSRHNFYDCETILELRDPDTGRRALLVVGDMDVNVDGSDGDRNVSVDDSGRFFQPQTSYRWPKTTQRINPLLPKAETRLASLKAEYTVPGLSAKRNRELRDAIGHTTRTIGDLKSFSFLISKTDPSIVLPSFMLRKASSPFAPSIGDYAAVIYNGVVYPSLVGDAGPSFKVGEASLRLCQQINPKSSGYSRPVSSIKVAYLVFPGTAEKPTAPDLVKWHAKCRQYLDEIGGIAPDLHTWTNMVPSWPTPTPTPTPTPMPSPEQTPPAPDSATPPTAPPPSPSVSATPPVDPPEAPSPPAPESSEAAPPIVTPSGSP